MVHDHDHDDDHPAAPEAAPAQAAPALVAEAAALPRFDLGSGAGSPVSGRVAGQAPAADPSARSGAGLGVDAHAAGSDDVVHAAAAVQVPARLVQAVAPVYPGHARADDLEGDVGVEIVVDREGRVIDARVTRPAGHGFDAAALTAVRAYRFSAAQRDGRTVRVRMPWSVQFRLR
jgi:TonB family protein